MADRTVLLEDLLTLGALRERTYVLLEEPGTGMACLDLSARSGEDWYFARRWVLVRDGRRLLYRTVDRAEAAGFRFRVRTAPRRDADGTHLEEDEDGALRASEFHRSLDAEERDVHRALFPEEAELLEAGYDWDAHRVYRRGAPLSPDGFGRVVETTSDCVYEWVRVREESTWRRYPLQRLRTLSPSLGGTGR